MSIDTAKTIFKIITEVILLQDQYSFLYKSNKEK